MSARQSVRTYRVGGAVRDQLLGYPSTETDWVVVGATPDELLERGFRQVGKDFPVFLHPDTGEEYALARTERKSGHGYYGFTLNASPDVTLEEDLLRRDLTINAMAMDGANQLIDPWGGRADLEAKVLRHVSPAFREDPLRVLRVARFAARYHHLGFSVADDTLQLMTDIVAEGELGYLPMERVWTETERALGSQSPEVYFLVLDACNALGELLPELADRCSRHLLPLSRVAQRTEQVSARWAALLCHLDDDAIREIAKRLRIPNAFRDLSLSVAFWRNEADHSNPIDLLALLTQTHALKDPEPFDKVVSTLAALASHSGEDNPTTTFFYAARDAVSRVQAGDFSASGLQGAALGEAIRSRRLAALEALIAES